MNGARAELAARDLPEREQLRAAVGDAADLLVAVVGEDRAHVWVLLEDGDAREPAEAAVPGAAITSFSATLLSDEGDPAPTLYAVPIPFSIPDGELDELDTWYVEEHAPLLLAVDGWQRIRRYAVEAHSGEPWNRLSFHDLATADVIHDPGVVASMRTPRRQAFSPRLWFTAGGRAVLERI
jgi:hypothetical protein